MPNEDQSRFSRAVDAGRQAYRDRQLDAYPWKDAIATLLLVASVTILQHFFGFWRALAIAALVGIIAEIIELKLRRRSKTLTDDQPPSTDH